LRQSKQDYERRFLDKHPNYYKLYREANRERRLNEGRLYYQEHREEILKRQKQYEIIRADRNSLMHRHYQWKNLGLNVLKAEEVYQSSNLCAICEKPIGGKNKHLDHNHKTKEIRGVLCQKCNHLLGLASDNIEILRNAISYLDELKEKKEENKT